MDKQYSYNRFNSKGVRVGQAVYDILSTEHPTYSTEEVLSEMAPSISSYLHDAVEKGCAHFDSDFYIIHIFRKELGFMGVENCPAQRAHCFSKGPTDPHWFMEALPNATKTLYHVKKEDGNTTLLWSVPSWEDCKTIKKNPNVYDPDLVKWADQATQRK